MSPVPDPSAMAVNALSMSWKAVWAYPPPALLPQILQKVQRDQCELILIAPCWVQAVWFLLLLGILIDYSLQIPNIPQLRSQPRGLVHQDPSNLQLHARRVSGMPPATEAFRLTLPPASLGLSEVLHWRSMNLSVRSVRSARESQKRGVWTLHILQYY